MRGKAAERKADERKTETKAPEPNGDGKHIEITAQTAMQAEKLKGQVTKAVLDHVQGQSKPWQKMSEYEQNRCIHGCQDIASKLVHEAVRLTASRGFMHMPVSLGKFSVDAEKGIQCSFAMPRSSENLVALGERLGSVVLLVPMDVHDFMGEDAKPEPDVVGDLSIPKTGPGAPSDPEAEAKLGRGQQMPGDIGPMLPPHDPQTGEIHETAAT